MYVCKDQKVLERMSEGIPREIAKGMLREINEVIHEEIQTETFERIRERKSVGPKNLKPDQISRQLRKGILGSILERILEGFHEGNPGKLPKESQQNAEKKFQKYQGVIPEIF